ncbi:hypothetical protein OHV66_17135 [Acinetobacter baumannii]|uniref:hypothetical protein n=1 Tax=Acinetobacter pittii TaxID=48296 RepID=UPI00233FDA8F|nr:hypothetical protein [Acinetobacter baumannii]MDN8306467.1 hypothetical protein [Acinetobacter baumannii]
MSEEISNQIAVVEKYILMMFLSTPNLIVTKKTKKEEQIIFTDGSQITEMTQVEIITPTIDYEYLKIELAKNPFNLIKNIQDIHLTYIYFLTKDARTALWKNEIERVQKILTRIQKVRDIFAIMQENTLHIITPNKFDQPLSTTQLCFYFPCGNKIMLSQFFSSQKETNEFLSSKIQNQLKEAHRDIFYQMIEESYQQDRLWKNPNAVVESIKNIFNAHLQELVESNTSNFIKGRKIFIQLYTTIHKKLKKELKENRSLTAEQRSNAKQWLEKIEQLIIEQQNYKDQDFMFLKKYSYTGRILTDWLNQNENLKEQVIKAQ